MTLLRHAVFFILNDSKYPNRCQDASTTRVFIRPKNKHRQGYVKKKSDKRDDLQFQYLSSRSFTQFNIDQICCNQRYLNEFRFLVANFGLGFYCFIFSLDTYLTVFSSLKVYFLSTYLLSCFGFFQRLTIVGNYNFLN